MTREEVKEIILSHSPCKVYEDSTLENFTKSQLIELLKAAEHNWAVELAGNDQLKENVKDWEKVRHAHWAPTRGNKEWIHCTACGYEPPDDGGVWEAYDTNTYGTTDFCPWCGAKMDEVKENEC